MTYPPGQSITTRSSGISLSTLGSVPILVVGYTSGGSNDSLGFYTNAQDLKDDHGHGVGVELALSAIAVAGSVLLLRPTHTTAGAASAVTPTRIGTSVGTISVAGEPYLPFSVTILITETTSALGSGKFQFSLDNEQTWSGEKTIPAGGTYAIAGTNLTLTFELQSGTPDFEEGDTFTFTCTAPQYTTTNLADAWDVLIDQIGTYRFRRVMFGGQSTSAANAATMATAVGTVMDTADTYTYFARALMSAGTDTAANVKTNLADVFSHDRVGVVHGLAEYSVRDKFEGWGTPRVPALWPVAERAMATKLDENLGRKASGALRGVVRCRAEDGSWGHDEGVSQGFIESDRIICLRTYRGEPGGGVFVTNGFLKSSGNSDFIYFDWGTVNDAACEIIQREQDKLILRNLPVLSDGTGRLQPKTVDRLEKPIRKALVDALVTCPSIEPGDEGVVSSLTYNITRTNDYASSKQILSTYGIVPKFPVEGLVTEGGLVREV